MIGMWLLAWVLPAFGWDERGAEGVPTGRSVVAAEAFAPARPDWSTARVPTPAEDLGLVARETARELREQIALGSPLATAGLFSELGWTLDDVLETLDLVARVAEEDRGAPRQRLQDPAWLREQFEVWAWRPDREAAAARKVSLPDDRIRLTHYVVYQVAGSPVRTETYDTALYALPHDEQAGGEPLLRRKYTRMDVYAGVYEAGGEAAGLATPLVWLTRDGANQALMQGSVDVRLPDGTTRTYNVHENNGLPYDPHNPDLSTQARFWYFREVQGILGVEQIPLRPQAAVAGDVFNVGLGKIVALEWPGPAGPELRLTVLADTGGAFQPNRFQLDWLAGTFPDRAAYDAWAAPLPTRVRAHVLLRKRPG